MCANNIIIIAESEEFLVEIERRPKQPQSAFFFIKFLGHPNVSKL